MAEVNGPVHGQDQVVLCAALGNFIRYARFRAEHAQVQAHSENAIVALSFLQCAHRHFAAGDRFREFRVDSITA